MRACNFDTILIPNISCTSRASVLEVRGRVSGYVEGDHTGEVAPDRGRVVRRVTNEIKLVLNLGMEQLIAIMLEYQPNTSPTLTSVQIE